VYRVLSDAVDEGIVMNVYSGDKMEHFDGNTENHYHIRCKVCDRIFDSELPYQDSITQMGVEADSDFVILSHNLEFIGICPSCKDSLKSL
jgi:Fe2+ or Zn2+ uptake regulation protein